MMTKGQPVASVSGWRFKTGVALFGLGLICPVFVPLVAATGLPASWKAVLSGALALGIPEMLWLAAVAVMGKAGFDYLKQRVFGFLKRHVAPSQVSRTRYRIGLVMLLVPVVLGWVQPYASAVVEELAQYRIAVGVGGDVLLLVSLFVLGGEFWDKVQALFVHRTRADSPIDSVSSPV
jgi:hypothetical protein